ncbi:helix-turn-helix domain-containing protein [Sphingobacterium pedocola]|uniref:Transcriptional regulator n=1 Tax=Sphingobacterium pedocola TaxID=2082722 RepID=A0ABR9T361_9SPHI|nr:helix-turn-helix transcriptional regulator [Sphingobacterium pedocola]MBE8719777.1 transcriptional regulator [Sphingobacterium pedocola]
MIDKKHLEIVLRIGKKLKLRRIELELTQQQVADKIPKMDRAKISDMENGKEDFFFSKLLNVCDALEISVEETLKKDEE